MFYVLSLIIIMNAEYFSMKICKGIRRQMDSIAKADEDFAKFREIA